MSFFIRNKTKQRDRGLTKRKVTEAKIGKGLENKSKPKKSKYMGSEGDEEILSDSDIDSDKETRTKPTEAQSESEDEKETAQEKRLRLAKAYLSQLEETEKEKKDDEDDDGTDAISKRLKQDVLEQSGKLYRKVAAQVQQPEAGDIRILRGHKLPVTCVVISPDERHVFSAGKDCSIIKWDVETGKKVKVVHGGRKGTEKKHIGHTSQILCIAISTDGQFLVTGDMEKNIMVWNPDTCERLHILTGHRSVVSGVAFRKGTHTLFSTSHDRTVKIWNLDEMAYVETLFGHQDNLTAVDSLTRERAVTAGGRDGSIRIWKVIEESQLIFHGHSGSIDTVALIDEEHFISGADDNSVAVWGVMKKKPLATVNNAHGDVPTGSSGSHDNWVTSVAALQYSDLAASGSRDGSIRLWQLANGCRSIKPLFAVPMVGFVNGLKFSNSGDFLVAGLGQEHRLGRWWRMKEAKNGVAIIKLNKSQKQEQKQEEKQL